MNNRDLNDFQLSSKNFSCFYGTNCNIPLHQNNNEKYNESNPKFYKNYINNNINNLNPIHNNQIFNLNIEPGTAMRNVINQKYEDDPFKKRIHYLRNNNYNINNEFIIAKNNTMTYSNTSLRNHLCTNSNVESNNFKKFNDIMTNKNIKNNNIYNLTYNNSETDLKDNKLNPNQILFRKNMESLKYLNSIEKEDNISPIRISNNNMKNIITNSNRNNSNNRNNKISNYLQDNDSTNLNSPLSDENINLENNQSQSYIKNDNSMSTPNTKIELKKNKNPLIKKNSYTSNNSKKNKSSKKSSNKNILNKQISQFPIKGNSNGNSKHIIKNIINPNKNLSKINYKNLKKEERKNDKATIQSDMLNLDIKNSLEKEYIQYKNNLNKNDHVNKKDKIKEQFYDKNQIPKYKYISSLDELSKYSPEEQIKRLFHQNLKLNQELNDLRKENNILKDEIKNKNNDNIKSPKNEEDKFKNYILNENEKLNKINRINEKILDGLIDKINEIIKKQNISNAENEDSNLISYNQLFEEPDNTKIILDKILSLNKKKKILKNKQINSKKLSNNKSNELTSFKNLQLINNFTDENYNENNNYNVKYYNTNYNIENQSNNIPETKYKNKIYHKKSNSTNSNELINTQEYSDNNTQFYDYYNDTKKERVKNCYGCLYGNNHYTKGYSPLICSPNRNKIQKEEEENSN